MGEEDGGWGAREWRMREGGGGGVSGGWWLLGAPTPHLTSPLVGGRDELGKGVGVGEGGFLPAQE